MSGPSEYEEEDDGPPWWESWMTAQSEAQLFQQDAEAEVRRARLARAVLDECRRRRDIELGRQSAARTWHAILENLRQSHPTRETHGQP